MDRGHRAFLGWRPGGWLGGATVLLLPWFAGSSGHAQETPPAPPVPTASITPAVTATPWVQASPPAGFVTPPPPTGTPRPPQTPKPKPPKPPKQVSPPVDAPMPTASSSPADMMREMMRRRAAEEHAEASKPADNRDADRKAAEAHAAEARKEAARLDQLPPDERAAYQRNLPLWRQLPVEERQDIRQQADERVRQEIDKAYQESGLTLDRDQREVFDLRYRQERRRLERELQEKVNAERTRRLAEVTERLKTEFAGRTPPVLAPPAATATPAPKKAAPTPTVTNPDALLVPGGGFKR